MSLLRSESADRPKPSTVVSEPATVDACQADYADRQQATAPHPSSLDAQPHTSGRH